jgi:hypothetical protein
MPAEAVKIFGNIESIYDIHHSLLDSLKAQKKNWNYKSGVSLCFLNEVCVRRNNDERTRTKRGLRED